MSMETSPKLSNEVLTHVNTTFKSTLSNSAAFELNKNNSINSILAFIIVSILAFADHRITRLYLDKSGTIKPK